MTDIYCLNFCDDLFPKKDIALAVSLFCLNHALFHHLEQQSFGETLNIWNSNKRFLSSVRKEKRRKYIRYLNGSQLQKISSTLVSSC